MRRDRQLEAVTPRTVIRFCGVFKVVIGGTRGMKPVVRRDLRLQFSLLLLRREGSWNISTLPK
jgi:hypothetical protein